MLAWPKLSGPVLMLACGAPFSGQNSPPVADELSRVAASLRLDERAARDAVKRAELTAIDVANALRADILAEWVRRTGDREPVYYTDEVLSSWRDTKQLEGALRAAVPLTAERLLARPVVAWRYEGGDVKLQAGVVDGKVGLGVIMWEEMSAGVHYIRRLPGEDTPIEGDWVDYNYGSGWACVIRKIPELEDAEMPYFSVCLCSRPEQQCGFLSGSIAHEGLSSVNAMPGERGWELKEDLFWVSLEE